MMYMDLYAINLFEKEFGKESISWMYRCSEISDDDFDSIHISLMLKHRDPISCDITPEMSKEQIHRIINFWKREFYT